MKVELKKFVTVDLTGMTIQEARALRAVLSQYPLDHPTDGIFQALTDALSAAGEL